MLMSLSHVASPGIKAYILHYITTELSNQMSNDLRVFSIAAIFDSSSKAESQVYIKMLHLTCYHFHSKSLFTGNCTADKPNSPWLLVNRDKSKNNV